MKQALQQGFTSRSRRLLQILGLAGRHSKKIRMHGKTQESLGMRRT